MRAAIVVSLIYLIASNAGAQQQVYKCVRGNEVSYQSAACDGTQKVARKWEATPDPRPTADELRQRQSGIQRDREPAQSSRAAGEGRQRSGRNPRSPGSRKSGLSRCDAAKARREAKLQSVGLKRTFDLLRRLDDAVNEACK